MNSALVTYVYPQAIRYFSDLANSIKTQTYRDFDFIVFGDGISAHDLPSIDYNYLFIPISGSLAEIRIKSLAILKGMHYSKLVFVDADDTLVKNRMELSIELLNSYHIICNDLNTINESGLLMGAKIWSKRIKNGFEFNHEFLIDKNILGFGNTAIRREMLKFWITLPSSEVMAPDWFVFYLLLRESGKFACFSSLSQTNYRQHESNIAGEGTLSEERIKYVLEVKKNHYERLLENHCNEVNKEKLNVERLQNGHCFELNLDAIPDYLYWWEETNYINIPQ